MRHDDDAARRKRQSLRCIRRVAKRQHFRFARGERTDAVHKARGLAFDGRCGNGGCEIPR
jgi:hypothetical protein